MCLEAQVRRATVTSSRRRAGVFDEAARSKVGKKVPGSCNRFRRREAVTRFVTLEVEEVLARQFETRSLIWRRATRGTASKNE